MKSILFIFALMCSISYGQNDVGLLFEPLPNDSGIVSSKKLHSSVLPQIRVNKSAKSLLSLASNRPFMSITPLSDINGSYADSAAFRAGAGVSLESQNLNRFYFRLSAIGGIGTQDFNSNAYYKEVKANNYNYVDVRGRVSYTPNHIFNFQVGLDNNFIGDGNRSLFLSDYGVAQPFGEIRTRFWNVEYTVLYQFLREQLDRGWVGKNAASHHISLNLTKWWNVGVFETVIFQPKDTLLNRGYDVEYLNPVIFYRPQEYSLGSSDNVLLGLQMNLDYKTNRFYSQFIMDEFNLGLIKAKTGSWTTKIGGQVGVKGNFKLKKWNAFYRIEYNAVRPYTYAHINSLQNYGNQGATLSHPYGSNFHEILFELKAQQKKLLLKAFLSYSLHGMDKDGFSYGGNIYQPYTLRPYDDGHFIGQGIGVNQMIGIVSINYELLENVKLNCFLENHIRYNSVTNQTKYYPVIGLRSQLWNDYRNY